MMTGAAALSLSSSSAWAQATQAEVEALPMPPAAGELVWNVSMANVQVNTGYTRFTAPGFWTYAVPGDVPSGDKRQFGYFRFTGVASRGFNISSNWGVINAPGGGNGIPAPVNGTDACGHSHHVYGIWVRNRILFVTQWVRVTTGGKIGRRVNGVCLVSEQKTGSPFVDPFAWGPSSQTFTTSPFATEVIVAAQSPTHGWGTRWGSCGEFSCYDHAQITIMRTQ